MAVAKNGGFRKGSRTMASYWSSCILGGSSTIARWYASSRHGQQRLWERRRYELTPYSEGDILIFERISNTPPAYREHEASS